VTSSGPLAAVTDLDVGTYLACVRLADGEARCWGFGDHGNIGNGGTNDNNPRTSRVLT
jgi:alpha-tubulin suppressor-like RCC1 family protein